LECEVLQTVVVKKYRCLECIIELHFQQTAKIRTYGDWHEEDVPYMASISRPEKMLKVSEIWLILRQVYIKQKQQQNKDHPYEVCSNSILLFRKILFKEIVDNDG
jgi:hypothetical protein